MEFSHPSLLWGLPAVGLPLLIHLINRHRARRKAFAAIDFLLRVQKRSARRILLKQILLLILRSLLLLTLVLAAAGPRWARQEHGDTAGPEARALVIDASLSMRTRSGEDDLFGRALARARSLIRQGRPGDSTCLLRAGAEIEALLDHCSDSPARLLRVIDDLERQGPGWTGGDLLRAAERAAGLLAKDPRPRKRIILLSDGSAHAFGPGQASWPEGVSGLQVELEDLWDQGPRHNHAVTQAEARPGTHQPELHARFISYDDESREPAVRVDMAGEQVTQGLVRLEPAQESGKTFSLPQGKDQDALGRVQLPEDGLPEDDGRQFFLEGRSRLEALLVNGDMRPVLHKDELFYLEHALAPAAAGGPEGSIRFSSLTPDRLLPDRLGQAQVLFLANVRQLPPETTQALRQFVSSGGGLFLALGDRVGVDQGNAIFGDLLAWPLRDVVALGPLESDGRAVKGLAFGSADAKHPMLAPFGPDVPASLKGVRTRRAFVLEPGQSSAGRRVLLRFANGLPALVERRVGAGRVLLFTSSLDRDWTNWPARASFLPFMQQATAYLAGRLQVRGPLETEAGRAVTLTLEPGAEALVLDCPFGKFELGRAQAEADGTLRFRDTRQPGWCPIQQVRGGKAVKSEGPPGLLIHVPAAESDPRPMDEARLRQALGQVDSALISGPGQATSRSLATALLVLALLLVLGESLLIRR